MSTPAIQVHLFKDSYQPFTALLQEGGIEFNARTPPVGVPMNAGLAIEILRNPGLFPALAAVIIAFIKKPSRKVTITTRDGGTVILEGIHSQSEVEHAIAQAKSMAAIETARDQAIPAKCEPDI